MDLGNCQLSYGKKQMADFSLLFPDILHFFMTGILRRVDPRCQVHDRLITGCALGWKWKNE